MEDYSYFSDGEQFELMYGTVQGYCSERDYSDYSELSEGVEEGLRLEDCPYPYDDSSSPQYPHQGYCACEDQSDSADCSSSTASDWETDDGYDSVTSAATGTISSAESTVSNDSCRIPSSASSSSWETATSESESSWETASTCSCETAPCQCYLQQSSPRWDRTPPEDPDYSPTPYWMSHPIAEGGGRSGSLVPLLPSAPHLRTPRRRPYNLRRMKKMNSSGVGRRKELMKNLKVSEQKPAHRHPAHRPCIPTSNSAPANPVAAQKEISAQPRRRRSLRWNPLCKIKRKASVTAAVKIGDGVAGPSGINQRQLRAASCPKAVQLSSQ